MSRRRIIANLRPILFATLLVATCSLAQEQSATPVSSSPDKRIDLNPNASGVFPRNRFASCFNVPKRKTFRTTSSSVITLTPSERSGITWMAMAG